MSITIRAPSVMEAYQVILIAAMHFLNGEKRLNKEYATSSITFEVTDDEPAPA